MTEQLFILGIQVLRGLISGVVLWAEIARENGDISADGLARVKANAAASDANLDKTVDELRRRLGQ